MQEKLDSTIGLKCEAALQKCEEHKNKSESALTNSIDALKIVARWQNQKTLFPDVSSVLLPPPLPSEKRTHQTLKAESFERAQTLPFCDLSEASEQKLSESDKTPVQATQILNKASETLRTSKTELRQSTDKFKQIEKEWKKSVTAFKKTEKKWNQSIITTERYKTEHKQKKLLQKTDAMTNIGI